MTGASPSSGVSLSTELDLTPGKHTVHQTLGLSEAWLYTFGRAYLTAQQWVCLSVVEREGLLL